MRGYLFQQPCVVLGRAPSGCALEGDGGNRDGFLLPYHLFALKKSGRADFVTGIALLELFKYNPNKFHIRTKLYFENESPVFLTSFT